jgi:hypothetical protein
MFPQDAARNLDEPITLPENCAPALRYRGLSHPCAARIIVISVKQRNL